jgi:lipase chaperone LimK
VTSRRGGAALLMLAALVLLVFLLRPPAGETLADIGNAETISIEPASDPAAGTPVSDTRAARPLPTPLSSLPPRSLIGTDPDGAIGVHANGELRIDLGLRRWFDWHRAAIGERDEVSIRAAITAAMIEQLPAPQVAMALAVYDRYLALLAASDQLPFDPDPLVQLDALRALRIEHLGAQLAEAFFAEEELALEARLLRRRLAHDRSLDPAEREARLAALDASLPDELKPSPEVRMAQQAEELSDAYDAAGTSAEERFAERSELFGADAAGRLAELDLQRQDWRQRTDAYAALHARLRGDPRLSESERRQALQRWMLEHFDEAERRRLQALIDEGLFGGF